VGTCLATAVTGFVYLLGLLYAVGDHVARAQVTTMIMRVMMMMMMMMMMMVMVMMMMMMMR
jgi:hypothetical protein